MGAPLGDRRSLTSPPGPGSGDLRGAADKPLQSTSSFLGEDKALDKEAIAISLLAKGQPKAYMDFFSLTHPTLHGSDKRTSQDADGDAKTAEGAEAHSGDDDVVPPESFQALSRQLVRAEVGEERGDMMAVVDSYNSLASHFEQIGHLKRALMFYHRALDAAVAGHCGMEELNANLALGLVHQRLGELTEAAEWHERYLKLAASSGVEMSGDAALRSLVDVYKRRADENEKEGNVDEAISYLNRCMDAAEKVGDVASAALANQRLGSLHQERGNFEKALHYHTNYLDMSRDAQDKEAEGKAFCGMAECHQALGDMNKAVRCLEQYLEISRMQDPSGQARACCNLGIIYFHQRRFDQSVTYFEKFFEVARTLENEKILDVARINLGTARGVAAMQDYMEIVNGDVSALLQWKNARVPFSDSS